MGWILHAYECECGHFFEDLVDREDLETTCPECGQILNKPVLGGKVASFSIMSKEQQTASLKKRSADHSARSMKKYGEVI